MSKEQGLRNVNGGIHIILYIIGLNINGKSDLCPSRFGKL